MRKVIYHNQIAWFLIPHYLAATSPFSYPEIFDPRVAAYLCDSTMSDQDLELHNLCARCSLLVIIIDSPRYGISSEWQINFDGLGKNAQYLARLHEDLQSLLALYQTLARNLIDSGSLQAFENLEMPLSCLLSRMEFQGISVSLTTLETISTRLRAEINRIEGEAYHLVGQSFNLSSPEQVLCHNLIFICWLFLGCSSSL